MAGGARAARALATVERVCATATTADELLDALDDAVQTAVPHDASFWSGLDPVTLLATAPSRVDGMDAKLCDTYWHLEFHEQDHGLLTDLARGDGASALRLALDDRPGRSVRFRQFLAPQGYADELRAVFRAGDSPWAAVGLYREGIHDPFDEDDLAFIRSVGPVVADALRVHVRQAVPWLEPTAPGLMFVGADGEIVSANTEAQHWLRLVWPSAPDPLELDATVGRGISDLTPIFALVAKARAVADGRERGPARLRLLDERGRWIVLHASAMSGPGAGPASVAVVIEGAKGAEVAPIVIDAYSLTVRERQVLAAIMRGSSTSEIAAELFLSAHTVRDYVKAVFEKVGVSSRGELVARLFAEHYIDDLHASMVHLD